MQKRMRTMLRIVKISERRLYSSGHPECKNTMSNTSRNKTESRNTTDVGLELRSGKDDAINIYIYTYINSGDNNI